MTDATGACFHCGEPILPGTGLTATFDSESKTLCCHGCEMAVRVIHGAGLADYYRWRRDSAPRPTAGTEDEWSAYDRPEVLRGLGRAGDVTRANLGFEGVRCSACGWLIERRLEQIPGVVDVSMNPATARARVDFRGVPLSSLLGAVAELGYRPHVLGLADTAEIDIRERRTSLKRVAVAGFGMMQVMMIAVALYEVPRVGMSPYIQDFLRIASLLITTPVLFYAGAPFYRGAWQSLVARHLGMDVPVSAGVLLAFGASALNTLGGSGEVYFDSVVMFLFLLLLGRHLEMLARHRATSAAEALGRMLPAVACRLTANAEERVPIAALSIGDHVRVEVGEAFPTDGVIGEGETLADESLITGESRPVLKRTGAPVMAGAINLLRPAFVTVSALGESTVIAGIARLLERAAAERPHLTRLVDSVASRFVGCVLVGAGLTATVWLWVDPTRALPATVAVLVATCPCALSLATPVAVTAAMSALARCGVLVSRPDALEGLASADHVVLDKTGTLTLGNPRVVGQSVLGTMAAAECLDVASSLELASGHPLARAFAATTRRAVRDAEVVAGSGVEGWIDGLRYRIGHARFVAPLAGTLPALIGDDGVYLGREGEWLARFVLEDPLRPGIHAGVRQLAEAGFELEIASGDHDKAVAATAAAVGVARAAARLSPADKLARVRELQRAGKSVVVIGDGANDAPGLGAADISIAIGTGSALARADADVIVLGNDPTVFATVVRHARKTREVIHENLLWAAVYNLASLPLAAVGLMPPWAAAVGMSLSSLLVVTNSLRLSKVHATRAPEHQPMLDPAGALG